MNLLFYLSIPIVVVIACWHLALAGRPPDLISLNSPTLAAAVAMTEIFFVITNRFKNNIQGVTSLANVECYGCPFSSMIHNTSKVVLTYQTLQMAHIIIHFLSLTTLSLSKISYGRQASADHQSAVDDTAPSRHPPPGRALLHLGILRAPRATHRVHLLLPATPARVLHP